LNNFLDTCAFDPKCALEHESAQQIRELWEQDQVNLILAHWVQKEVDRPNTPADVKREATEMIYSIKTALTPDEVTRKHKIHAVLAGNGKPENYAADAEHVFEAGKYGGIFITTDGDILNKREALERVSRATILLPREWQKVFRASAP